jgi:nitrogenase molybdenum-iron protein alpha/beta subunit
MTTTQKNLVVNPLKVAPGLGAAYAAQGFRNAIPFFHSAPGCSFLSKVMLTQHFMEPVAVSGSDIKETALVFGGTNELESAIKKFCSKNKPEIIFVLSSSIPEVRGEIYDSFWEDSSTSGSKVIIVKTPDFQGGFSEGFSKLVYNAIDELARGGEKINSLVNILPAPYMTAGDIDEMRIILEAFNLDPVFIPDISLGVDGSKEKFSSMSIEGTTASQLEQAGRATATISIGNSMKSSGDLLEKKFGIKHINLESIYGLAKTDNLIVHLLSISPGTEIAYKLVKERARLKDIMIDTHLILNNTNAAIALEYDQAIGYKTILNEIGVSSNFAYAPVLPSDYITGQISQGSLYDIELAIFENNIPDVIISNSHGKELSSKFNIPLIRAGFPVHDVYGFNYKTSIGYKGAIEIISELANVVKENLHTGFSGQLFYNEIDGDLS